MVKSFTNLSANLYDLTKNSARLTRTKMFLMERHFATISQSNRTVENGIRRAIRIEISFRRNQSKQMCLGMLQFDTAFQTKWSFQALYARLARSPKQTVLSSVIQYPDPFWCQLEHRQRRNSPNRPIGCSSWNRNSNDYCVDASRTTNRAAPFRRSEKLSQFSLSDLPERRKYATCIVANRKQVNHMNWYNNNYQYTVTRYVNNKKKASAAASSDNKLSSEPLKPQNFPLPVQHNDEGDGSKKFLHQQQSFQNQMVLRRWFEQLQSIPNMITVSRILIIPIISYWILTQQTLPAVVGCIYAALSDVLDGYLARRYPHMQTPLGTYLDPLGA
jgi:hypothetical protein